MSWEVLNSVFTHNEAIGRGANPARSGTPGGGSGGAVYTDGNRYTVRVAGTRMEERIGVTSGTCRRRKGVASRSCMFRFPTDNLYGSSAP